MLIEYLHLPKTYTYFEGYFFVKKETKHTAKI